MMNTKIYTAITIGPIYDTFTQAKRTRSIWAASYFFSLFMRKILEQAIDNDWDILLPYDKPLDDNTQRGVNKGKYGAGLYADRLYFVNKSKLDVQGFVDNTIKFFAEDIYCKNTKLNYENVLVFLRNYLNLHVVEISLTDEELASITTSKNKVGKSDNSVLKILNNLLDNKELNKRYAFDIKSNPLIDYFATKWNENTALKEDAFGFEKGRHFKSIAEISTADLLKEADVTTYNRLLEIDFKNEDIQIIDLLKKNDVFKEKMQDYHKYYAVLYADGDNIGALLNSVANDRKKLKTFSEKLLRFEKKAEESIHNYGGSAIYLGGEDILAFLPIAYNGDNYLKSLAILIKDLDKDFEDTLGQYAEEQGVTIPTLSYGLMLSYYKFPMREAMEQAHNMLEKCKQEKELFPQKNGVSVRFQKHSGQYMECFIDKSKTASAKRIYELLTLQLQGKDKKDTLSGMIQRLKDDVFFTTFIHAVRNDRIDAFIENFFNEEIHEEKNSFTDYFTSLIKVLKQDYLTVCSKEEEYKQNKRFKDVLFTILRYYQFIQPKKSKDQ